MAVQIKKFVRLIFESCFQVRDFFFWITQGIGLTGASLIFDLKHKFCRVAAI
jgi:hypothetical protein